MLIRNPKLLWILVVCFVLRFSFFLVVKPWSREVESTIILGPSAGDALGYHLLARTIVEYGEFSHHLFSADTRVAEHDRRVWFFGDEQYGRPQPELIRTPGYPLFVAFIYFVVGSMPWVVLLAQILLDALNCFLIYSFVGALINQSSAQIAAVFYAIDPFVILHSVSFMSETLFVTFLILFAYYYVRGATTGITKGLWISAFLLSGAVLVRPVVSYLVLLVGMGFIWIHRSRLVPAVSRLGLFLSFFVLGLSPWIIRNIVVFGVPYVSVSSDYNLLFLHVKPLVMYTNKLTGSGADHFLETEVDSYISANGLNPNFLDQAQKAPFWRSVALKHISANPIVYVALYLKGTLQTFVTMGSSEFARMLRWTHTRVDIQEFSTPTEFLKAFVSSKSAPELFIASSNLMFQLVSLVALCVGLWKSSHHMEKEAMIFLVLVMLYFLMTAGPSGYLRFKVPLIPFYLPFVAIGIREFSNYYDLKRRINE